MHSVVSLSNMQHIIAGRMTKIDFLELTRTLEVIEFVYF